MNNNFVLRSMSQAGMILNVILQANSKLSEQRYQINKRYVFSSFKPIKCGVLIESLPLKQTPQNPPHQHVTHIIDVFINGDSYTKC